MGYKRIQILILFLIFIKKWLLDAMAYFSDILIQVISFWFMGMLMYLSGKTRGTNRLFWVSVPICNRIITLSIATVCVLGRHSMPMKVRK